MQNMIYSSVQFNFKMFTINDEQFYFYRILFYKILVYNS